MIEWIFYFLGIVFLVMLLKSLILKPILFKEKWQSGVMYGLPTIICFLIFFMLIYSDYNSEQVFIKNKQNDYSTTAWQPPRVSGSETAVQPGSANYISIPVPQSKNLQNGLISLQNDLNALQKSMGMAQSSTTTAQTTNVNSKQQAYTDANGRPAIIGDPIKKTYIIPGSANYNTKLKNTDNDNVYFRSEEEAETAGFKIGQ